jgi:hypothetical protein
MTLAATTTITAMATGLLAAAVTTFPVQVPSTWPAPLARPFVQTSLSLWGPPVFAANGAVRINGGSSAPAQRPDAGLTGNGADGTRG